jgi:histidine triad (HIT) family protein
VEASFFTRVSTDGCDHRLCSTLSPTVTEAIDCFVCRKHRGELDEPGGAIYDDGVVRAGHALLGPGGAPAYLGYLFAEPLRHAPGLADLSEEESCALGLLITRLSRALVASERAEHVYAFVLGDEVPHLHVHLVPRYPGTPRELWGLRVTDWLEAPRGGRSDIEALCGRIERNVGGGGQIRANRGAADDARDPAR